jgi:hypothetical protein
MKNGKFMLKILDFLDRTQVNRLKNVRRKKLTLTPARELLFQQEHSPAKRYFFTFPFSFQLCCNRLVYRMKILKKDRSASFQETGREGFIP